MITPYLLILASFDHHHNAPILPCLNVFLTHMPYNDLYIVEYSTILTISEMIGYCIEIIYLIPRLIV